MTDKQIIEYKHIKCTRDDCCHYCGSVFCGYVDDIENLEKAYKRKEQECEEFRKANDEKNELLAKLGCPTIATARRKVFCLQEQLDRLKADNEKIKTALKFRDSNIDAKNKEIIRKCKNNRELIDKNWKLIKTLTEIKEIAEDLITITDEYDNCYHKDECDKCLLGIDGNCQYIKVEQILQKISECEGNNDYS